MIELLKDIFNLEYEAYEKMRACLYHPKSEKSKQLRNEADNLHRQAIAKEKNILEYFQPLSEIIDISKQLESKIMEGMRQQENALQQQENIIKAIKILISKEIYPKKLRGK